MLRYTYRPQFNRTSVQQVLSSSFLLDVWKRGLGLALGKTRKPLLNVSFTNSWPLREIRHVFDLWMIASNSQCNFFRLHFTNEYKFVRYLFLCFFVYLFFSIFASVSLLQEGTRDHGHYEHLLEGKLLWKWSWLLWTSLGRKHHSNSVKEFFHVIYLDSWSLVGEGGSPRPLTRVHYIVKGSCCGISTPGRKPPAPHQDL